MSGENILVVGESEVRRAVIEKILSASGYKVDSLKETYNIFKRLENASYRLLIIDINGFKKDPCLLLQGIRDEYGPLPIITLSDRNLVSTYNSKLNNLTNKLIVSPLDPKALLHAIDEVLQGDTYLNRKENPPDAGLDGHVSFSENKHSPPSPQLSGSIKQSEKRIIAIGGGKGGVGKSIVTANLGAGLAKEGKKVIAVDADIGGPNLHTCLGIKKLKYGLFDFLLKQEMSLAETAFQTTIPGLKIIGITDDYAHGVNINDDHKSKLIEELQQLDADYILMDLGSGTTSDVIDYFTLTREAIIITTPEITSVLNTYSCIKSVLYRKMAKYFRQKGKDRLLEIIRKSANPENEMKIKRISELEDELIKIDPDAEEIMRSIKQRFNVKLILNMLKSPADEKIALSIKEVTKNYLNMNIEILGPIRRDSAVEASVKSMSPFVINAPASIASACMYSILRKINTPKMAIF